MGKFCGFFFKPSAKTGREIFIPNFNSPSLGALHRNASPGAHWHRRKRIKIRQQVRISLSDAIPRTA
jgi:hypothetical protein